MDGVVIDRIYFARSDQFAVVRVDCNVDVGLEIGQIFVTDGERIALHCANGRSLRDVPIASEVHPGIMFFPGADSGNFEIVDTGLPEEAVTTQVSGENSAATDDAYPNHGDAREEGPLK